MVRNSGLIALALVFIIVALAVADTTGRVQILTSGGDGDSTTTSSDSGLETINSEVTMLRGCSDGELLKWDETNDDWDCSADSTAAGGHTVALVLENASDTDDALLQWQAPQALTVTQVDCSTDTGTTTIQLDERTLTTPNSAGTDIMTSTLACDSDNQQTSSFTNAGIAAGALISMDVDSVTSSPGITRVHIRFTYDD